MSVMGVISSGSTSFREQQSFVLGHGGRFLGAGSIALFLLVSTVSYRYCVRADLVSEATVC